MANDFASRAIALSKGQTTLPSDFVDDCTVAFISMAAVYYARATNTQSKHRKTFEIRTRLDEAELRDHDLICGLRDDAIAHYGPGVLGPDDNFRADYMLLPEDGQQIVMLSRQTARNRAFAELVRRQSQRALILTQRSVHEREVEMVSALNDAVAIHPALGVLARDHTLDLDDLFGDPDLAKRALAGPRVGTRRI